MPNLIVCDDSQFARRQLLRALPADLAANVREAKNGLEALALLRESLPDLMFLDLTMPEMDGYGVLQAMRDEGLKTRVIVVSGDVQDQARERVLAQGALTFVQKPIAPDAMRAALMLAGLLGGVYAPAAKAVDGKVAFRDAFREVCNVAMGRAAALLARVLDAFVQLPVPQVNLLEVGELQMALSAAQADTTVSAVCQGYISPGIAGEALLLFHDASFSDIAGLMKHENDLGPQAEMEMLMDIASIIIGACLQGISEQLDVRFSQGHPVVLGRHCDVGDLLRHNANRWKRTLAVEICYGLEGRRVHFDLLLLFTEDSVARLQKKIAWLAEVS